MQKTKNRMSKNFKSRNILLLSHAESEISSFLYALVLVLNHQTENKKLQTTLIYTFIY